MELHLQKRMPKSLDDSLKIAESIIGLEVARLPMNEEDIRSIIKSAKQ
jgi:hypothetical protein